MLAAFPANRAFAPSCRKTATNSSSPATRRGPIQNSNAISAQACYAAGILEILESSFGGTPIREEYLIVNAGALAGTGARSYKLTLAER